MLRGAGAFALGAAALRRPATAAGYPERPVRIIVPFAAGGPSDLTARLMSDKLREGDVIRVKVLEVDRQGRIRLSMRDVEAD